MVIKQNRIDCNKLKKFEADFQNSSQFGVIFLEIWILQLLLQPTPATRLCAEGGLMLLQTLTPVSPRC